MLNSLSLHKQVLLWAILALTNYNIQAVISSPMPAAHKPEASFRVGIAKGPANTVTTTLTPADNNLATNSDTQTKPKIKNLETKKIELMTATPQVLVVTAPASMGAVILMGGNNNVKNRSNEALVVLIPYNTEQLSLVSNFTKWLYEQQTLNLRKLEDKIAKKSQSLKLRNVKTVTITRADLQQYITNTGASFEHAVNRFAEDLGRYEKIMSKLQFSDLKAATLSKMEQAKK